MYVEDDVQKSMTGYKHPVSTAAFPTSIPLHGRQRHPSSKRDLGFGEKSLGNMSRNEFAKSWDSNKVLLTGHFCLSAT